MRCFLIILFFILFSFSLYPQDNSYQCGARSLALSNASVVFMDPWSIFNNQASLAFLNNISLGIAVKNYFNLTELNEGALTFCLPLQKQGTFGLSVYYFNNSTIYSQQKFGLAYAIKLTDKLSSGIQLKKAIQPLAMKTLLSASFHAS